MDKLWTKSMMHSLPSLKFANAWLILSGRINTELFPPVITRKPSLESTSEDDKGLWACISGCGVMQYNYKRTSLM